MDIKYFSTPILLIVWRRPKETLEVINSLSKIKPRTLFISCDGPRLGDRKEAIKVKRTQEVCKEFINWECDVKWQISDSNLGCKAGVVSAINWFFNNVQEGIILEDDNVAHPDFSPAVSGGVQRLDGSDSGRSGALHHRKPIAYRPSRGRL